MAEDQNIELKESWRDENLNGCVILRMLKMGNYILG